MGIARFYPIEIIDRLFLKILLFWLCWSPLPRCHRHWLCLIFFQLSPSDFFPPVSNKTPSEKANHNIIGSRKISKCLHEHGYVGGWLGAFYET